MKGGTWRSQQVSSGPSAESDAEAMRLRRDAVRRKAQREWDVQQ